MAASFASFRQEFAPLFGRTEARARRARARRARARSEQYLQGLLVQQPDRPDAETASPVAEVIVDATPRTLQGFLTEAPWAAASRLNPG